MLGQRREALQLLLHQPAPQLQPLRKQAVLAVGQLQPLRQGEGLARSRHQGHQQRQPQPSSPAQPPRPLRIRLQRRIKQRQSAPALQGPQRRQPGLALQQQLQLHPQARAQG